ncbi:MAG: sigma-70 family RNA polymerase sigma factor [Bryobacteraceae bacterium]
MKRCLENANSRAAMEFYFNETPAALPPEWPLDRLLAWLHAILHNVVREERNRAGYWREVESTERPNGGEFAASAPDPLEALMQQEVAAALGECIGKLEHDQRTVLRLRARGMKYGEIADRMGVNENTVATWISRGTRMLGKLLRSRLGGGDAG